MLCAELTLRAKGTFRFAQQRGLTQYFLQVNAKNVALDTACNGVRSRSHRVLLQASDN